ncbi:uncharacterized protein OCT59_009609 [Rhizophagus irregularis]|uniref:uncharacterized protein n=1 Tax=Rhizophagus irregularis TaxID=588596 RepID=UPI00331DE293|nr:hypothetical protein OCT59_009609 [Rhizophagus irregularis]
MEPYHRSTINTSRKKFFTGRSPSNRFIPQPAMFKQIQHVPERHYHALNNRASDPYNNALKNYLRGQKRWLRR